jgi:hypothetical protein
MEGGEMKIESMGYWRTDEISREVSIRMRLIRTE